MSAYHATHASPYDDACPDCTGMEWEDDDRDWSGIVATLCAAALVLIAVFAWRFAK